MSDNPKQPRDDEADEPAREAPDRSKTENSDATPGAGSLPDDVVREDADGGTG